VMAVVWKRGGDVGDDKLVSLLSWKWGVNASACTKFITQAIIGIHCVKLFHDNILNRLRIVRARVIFMLWVVSEPSNSPSQYCTSPTSILRYAKIIPYPFLWPICAQERLEEHFGQVGGSRSCSLLHLHSASRISRYCEGLSLVAVAWRKAKLFFSSLSCALEQKGDTVLCPACLLMIVSRYLALVAVVIDWFITIMNNCATAAWLYVGRAAGGSVERK
jgi:hypothetical protein